MVDIGSWISWDRGGLPFGQNLHSSPPRRKRTLTGPLDPTRDSLWHKIQVFSAPEPEPVTYAQDQCLLLSGLPLDIRMMIYDLVLGGKDLHVTWADESKMRIVAHTCKRPAGLRDSNHETCFACSDRRPSSAPREDYPEATGLLPLLTSCRRIYSEAIETLYSGNTFEFWENKVASKFLRLMVPQQRLRCIRRFRWDMQIPHHPSLTSRSQKDWSDLFTFFTEETCGLQHLYLKVNKNHRIDAGILATPDNEATGWIQPMVLMAVNANHGRSCRVEIVINGVMYEPAKIYKAIQAANPRLRYDTAVEMACSAMHHSIRLSLDAPG